MRLTEAAISEFQQIYQKKHGVLLSSDEANKKGIELLKLMALIYQPIPKSDEAFYKQLQATK